jgi:hypothetical protein
MNEWSQKEKEKEKKYCSLPEIHGGHYEAVKKFMLLDVPSSLCRAP